MKNPVNIVFAGIGGQGVLKASDITAETAFTAGMDVKKAEVHGMSQRGGSVTSDVRFGDKIDSPMVSSGKADFLVVFEETQVENNRHYLAPDGVLITCNQIDESELPMKKTLNVAIVGILSTYLELSDEHWKTAIMEAFPEKFHEINFEAFALGQKIARSSA